MKKHIKTLDKNLVLISNVVWEQYFFLLNIHLQKYEKNR